MKKVSMCDACAQSPAASTDAIARATDAMGNSRKKLQRTRHCVFVPSEQPERNVPDGIRAVVNLRGHRFPTYEVPPRCTYISFFIPGGPSPRIKLRSVEALVKKLHRMGGRILVHCQHGVNRTGLVWCLGWLMSHANLDTTSSRIKAAAHAFHKSRGLPIARPWVVTKLECWEKKRRRIRMLRL